jgi:hypothetical protein
VALENGKDVRQLIENQICGIHLAAVQPDVPADDVPTAPLRKLSIVTEKHGALLVGVDRQIVVDRIRHTSVVCRPRLVSQLSQLNRHGYVHALVAEKPH